MTSPQVGRNRTFQWSNESYQRYTWRDIANILEVGNLMRNTEAHVAKAPMATPSAVWRCRLTRQAPSRVVTSERG